MRDDDDRVDWNPDEQAAFEALPRERRPPEAVTRTIVDALAAEGLVRHAPRQVWMRRAGMLAAGLLLFVAGVASHPWLLDRAGSEAPRPSHVLMLYRDADATFADEASLAREYGRWAHRERAVIGGAELDDRGDWIEPHDRAPMESAGDRMLVGYFLLGGLEDEQALRVAERCPHLQRGPVHLRPITRR